MKKRRRFNRDRQRRPLGAVQPKAGSTSTRVGTSRYREPPGSPPARVCSLNAHAAHAHSSVRLFHIDEYAGAPRRRSPARTFDTVTRPARPAASIPVMLPVAPDHGVAAPLAGPRADVRKVDLHQPRRGDRLRIRPHFVLGGGVGIGVQVVQHEQARHQRVGAQPGARRLVERSGGEDAHQPPQPLAVEMIISSAAPAPRPAGGTGAPASAPRSSIQLGDPLALSRRSSLSSASASPLSAPRPRRRSRLPPPCEPSQSANASTLGNPVPLRAETAKTRNCGLIRRGFDHST